MVLGCGKKESDAETGAEAAVSQDRIDATRDALAGDMDRIDVGRLTKTHIGRQCVVTAQTPADAKFGPPPPPPPGMVHRLGQTTIYCGELEDISPDEVTVRAPYPTAGNNKSLKIARVDIQSIHLAKSP